MHSQHRWSRLCVVLCVAAPSFNAARGQCLEWSSGFEQPGVNGPVNAMAVYDDGLGAGPALYVGGEFSTAGAVIASNIAKWDGSNWAPLGSGVDDVVYALAVYSDGRLYAGGAFTNAGGAPANRIARWDGTTWTSVSTGTNNTVRSLQVFGGLLYVGGLFTTAGSVAAQRVASTNGVSWNLAGLNDFNNGTNGPVYSFAVYQGVLYIGGSFTRAGGPTGLFGVSSKNAVLWTGSAFGSLPLALDGAVRSMRVHDEGFGGGPELFMGGEFTQLGDGTPRSRILKWNGLTSFDVGGGTNNTVFALMGYDAGSGSVLYAGGSFFMAGGSNALNVAQWNGTSWSSTPGGTNGRVLSMTTFNDGFGTKLYFAGLFTVAGSGGANHVAKWDGTFVTSLGTGVNDGLPATVRALTSFDDGSGSGARLYAGGEFLVAGSVPAPNVARWNGVNWAAVGSGPGGPVFALAGFDDGTASGDELYAGGTAFNLGGPYGQSIAKWNGSTWSVVGNGLVHGLSGEVHALTVFDDGLGAGAKLYAGGDFTTSGSTFVRRVAHWNGSTWSPLGYGVSGPVNALAVFDDGSGGGPALYVGGAFGLAGGSVPANFIAKWNGSTWSPLGIGTDGIVHALAVFDDGSGGGPALFVGGAFSFAGGVLVDSIAKWNGSTWSALGGGKDNIVYTLSIFDDGTGSGPALYAGGDFTAAGGMGANNIARWNGSSWSLLAEGTNGIVRAITSFDDGFGGGADLFAGGDFTMAGSRLSSFVAAWPGCGGPGTAYCFGDDLDPLVTADCPCLNFGSPFHGCLNPSLSLGGARLDATGTVNPNTVRLICTGIPNNSNSFFVEGTASVREGFVFGDGVSCVSGTLAGFGSQFAGQGGNPPNTVAVLPQFVPMGTTRHYYVNYRTPLPGFCPPAMFNVSNAYSIAW